MGTDLGISVGEVLLVPVVETTDITPKDWNTCPECKELVDLPGGEVNQPGEHFDCVHCGVGLVADYLVDNQAQGEWVLLTAKEYDGPLSGQGDE